MTIVQHPRERRHAFGTVRIARLGLENVTVHVTERDAPPFSIPEGAVLLFPDPHAPVLSALTAEERPHHLVAIDGTWNQAAQLRRNHPALARLPAVRLAPETPSNYRIRREPSLEAISTIEAIVRALLILEPDTLGIRSLLASFDAMIDDQISQRDRLKTGTARHRHKRRLRTPPPAVLRNHADDLVLLYLEQHQPRGHDVRFPLRVSAARVDGQPLIDALVASPVPPSYARLSNLGLVDVSFDDALAPEIVAGMLRERVRPDDTLIAWAKSAEGTLRRFGLTQPFLSVKHYFANTRIDRPVGELEGVVRELDGRDPDPWFPGRAGLEVAMLARVVTAMRDRGATYLADDTHRPAPP